MLTTTTTGRENDMFDPNIKGTYKPEVLGDENDDPVVPNGLPSTPNYTLIGMYWYCHFLYNLYTYAKVILFCQTPMKILTGLTLRMVLRNKLQVLLTELFSCFRGIYTHFNVIVFFQKDQVLMAPQ